MFFFLSCVFVVTPLFILGIAILFWITQDYDLEIPATILTVIGSLGILIVTISIPGNRIETKGKIREFHAVQTTVDIQRKIGKETENAAMILKITEMNQWLASTKYYRELFIFWYPKEIENLEPIK